MATSLVSAVVFAAAVHALAYPGPKATEAAKIPLDATSPRPTTPPSLHEFLRRDSSNEQTVLIAPDNTCGYVSGQAGAAYTCVEKNALCVFVTISEGGRSAGAAGCCNTQECGFRLACLDYNQISSSSQCDSNCMTDTFTEKCTARAAPYCNTIAFPGGVTDYFCNSLSMSTAQHAETTFSGQTGRTLTQTVIADTRSLMSTPPSTTAATSSTTQTSAPTTSAPAAAAAASATPVGAIVGGVVGGVAVVGLLGLGFWFIKRQDRKSKPDGGPTPESQQLYPNGPGGSLPPAFMAASPDPSGKQGHQSLMSQYSNVSPYSSPPANHTHFSMQSGSGPSSSGYYSGGGGYEQGSPGDPSRFSAQSGGYGQGQGQALNAGMPVELGGTSRQRPVHELM
ncbi:hypothetical protein QBC47DRAFT_28699 [Echria macrotheca]|uniref:Uncharacterized protein n=1 Tax=Echria macrotheca TaxID=438768 RepID=A0AAJ0FGU3_9PEZI|nr:hypothetical protein QBC47DRAFT_28699 [Echria macrotheca]